MEVQALLRQEGFLAPRAEVPAPLTGKPLSNA
jgi:hypothetical protein